MGGGWMRCCVINVFGRWGGSSMSDWTMSWGSVGQCWMGRRWVSSDMRGGRYVVNSSRSMRCHCCVVNREFCFCGGLRKCQMS